MDERTIQLDEWTGENVLSVSKPGSVSIRAVVGEPYLSKLWLDLHNTRCQPARAQTAADLNQSFDIEEITVKSEPTSSVILEAEWDVRDGRSDEMFRGDVDVCEQYICGGKYAPDSCPDERDAATKNVQIQPTVVITRSSSNSKEVPRPHNEQQRCDISENGSNTEETGADEPKVVPKKPVFFCNVCHKAYLYKWRLERHLRSVHSRSVSNSTPEKPASKTNDEASASKEKPIYSCKHCDKTYTYHWHLSNHMRAAHRRVIWKAPSVKSKIFKKHVQDPKPKKPSHFCNLCQKTYHYEYHLNYHMRIHHPGHRTSQLAKPKFFTKETSQGKLIYFCGVCKKAYMYLWRMNNHFRLEHGGNMRKLQSVKSDVDKDNISETVNPSSSHANKGEADNQGKDARGKDNVSRLVKLESELPVNSVIKLTACKYCDKKYARVVNLENHMRLVHNARRKRRGKKPWQCEDCDKSYTRKDRLKSHIIRWHPGNLESNLSAAMKRLYCKYCGKRFLRPYHLDNHIRLSHLVDDRREKVTAWQCKQCEKSYTRKQKLDAHIRTQHSKSISEVKAWQCKDCDKGYSRRNNLNLHIRTAHPERSQTTPTVGSKYECEACKFCNKKFARVEDVETHVRLCHPVKTDPAPSAPATDRPRKCQTRRQCQHCDKSFIRKDHLRTHIRRNHHRRDRHKRAVSSLVKNRQCNYCGASFLGVSCLKAHVQQFHAEKVGPAAPAQPLAKSKKCELCGKRYIRMISLKNHVCQGPVPSGVPSDPAEPKPISTSPPPEGNIENVGVVND